METSRQPERPPEFSDAQLQYIIQLAKRDGLTAAFFESMDQRAVVDVGRSAVIGTVGYRAVEILGYRQKVREAREKQLKELAEKRVAEAAKVQEIMPPAPRIPASEIPDVKPVNGAPEA